MQPPTLPTNNTGIKHSFASQCVHKAMKVAPVTFRNTAQTSVPRPSAQDAVGPYDATLITGTCQALQSDTAHVRLSAADICTPAQQLRRTQRDSRAESCCNKLRTLATARTSFRIKMGARKTRDCEARLTNCQAFAKAEHSRPAIRPQAGHQATGR
jgi:hypothetical protein